MTDRIAAGLARRHRAERRFRAYGVAALAVAFAFMGAMFVAIAVEGAGGFRQTVIGLEVTLDPAVIDASGGRDPVALARADYGGLVKRALRARFPEVSGRRAKRALYKLISVGAGARVRDRVRADPGLIGQSVLFWLPAASDVDMLIKGRVAGDGPEDSRRIDDRQRAWIDALIAEGRVETRFDSSFFTNADSREPELAGVLGAVVGSAYALAVCLALAFPLGVAAAIHLEEFASRSRWAEAVEITINNLAAVPSIVFGLLGLAIFLDAFDMPRSAPLVGGMVLALMTLPTIIIAARAALKAVPPSVRQAALALGASRAQAVFHHVLPLAMPGVLTGTIIGMAQALGESAPLLMIGMVAFIIDVPGGPTDPATALPVQIYLWADSHERGFTENTAAAIMVLLAFLIAMNLVAVVLRKKFEKRW